MESAIWALTAPQVAVCRNGATVLPDGARWHPGHTSLDPSMLRRSEETMAEQFVLAHFRSNCLSPNTFFKLAERTTLVDTWPASI